MTTYVTNNENATAFAFHGSEVVVLGVSDLGGFVVDFGSFIIDGVPADELVEDATEADLIHEAGMLNNNAKLVNTDHVSIMGLMNRAEMVTHVAKLREMVA